VSSPPPSPFFRWSAGQVVPGEEAGLHQLVAAVTFLPLSPFSGHLEEMQHWTGRGLSFPLFFPPLFFFLSSPFTWRRRPAVATGCIRTTLARKRDLSYFSFFSLFLFLGRQESSLEDGATGTGMFFFPPPPPFSSAATSPVRKE